MISLCPHRPRCWDLISLCTRCSPRSMSRPARSAPRGLGRGGSSARMSDPLELPAGDSSSGGQPRAAAAATAADPRVSPCSLLQRLLTSLGSVGGGVGGGGGRPEKLAVPGVQEQASEFGPLGETPQSLRKTGAARRKSFKKIPGCCSSKQPD